MSPRRTPDPSWCPADDAVNRRLARSVAGEPGPLYGGDIPLQVGDRSEECGPSLA